MQILLKLLQASENAWYSLVRNIINKYVLEISEKVDEHFCENIVLDANNFIGC